MSLSLRTRLAVLVMAIPFAGFLATPAHAQGAGDGGRTIVLGMDGADAQMASDWMDEGKLPNFSRLRDMGTFAPLNPANPAQSPVSWATLNTGVNPGKHGIFDFVGVRLNADRSRPVLPDLGFQEPTQRTAEELGLPFASSNAPFLIMGGAGVLALVVFLVFRRKMAVGVVAAVAILGGGVWYGMSWMNVYPEGGFKDYVGGNKAQDYWEALDEAGIPFRGQGTIVSYPVQELEHGKLVAGLGAPDATGNLNSSAIYTTADTRRGPKKDYSAAPAYTLDDAPDAGVSFSKAGTVGLYKLVDAGGGRLESKLYGPLNQVKYDALREELNALQQGGDRNRINELNKTLRNTTLLNTWVPLEVTWKPGATSIDLTVDGTTQSVAIGSWSEFFFVKFPWNQRFSTNAMVRIWAEERDGELEMFASPLQIDPDAPLPGSRASWPPQFAAELKSRIGAFETLGWACQTHAVKDAELSDDAFVADIEYTLSWRTKMLKDAMAGDDWKVLFHFFGTPDRICHMLMRHMDPLHPQYDEALASREITAFGRTFPLKDSGLVIYQEMDKLVGYMLDEAMQEGDTLMIVSDHGFDSFRYQVDLNAWLAKEGFLAIDNLSRLGTPKLSSEIKRDTLGFVDWEQTQAYSIAIGKIYLNLVGREHNGIVTKEEADALLAKITERLYAMTNPNTGEKMVRKVYLRDELYSGPHMDPWKSENSGNTWNGAAEITIDFAPGYRASWGVTGGGINLQDVEGEDGEAIAGPGDFVFDNTSPWSGDHCGVDIHSVQGIFFSNRKMTLPEGDTQYDATHLAPTVLSLNGVTAPADYDKKSLVIQ